MPEQERVTRGQFMRFFQIAIRRGPAGLRKDWLYTNLKPMVDNLEADLIDDGVLAPKDAKNAPQEPEEKPVDQGKQEEVKNEAQTETEPVKEPEEKPSEKPAKKAGKNDLGDDPKKPARKGKK